MQVMPATAKWTAKKVGMSYSAELMHDRDFNLLPHWETAIGAQTTVYTPGSRLQPIYGSDPMGVAIFVRLRPIGK